MRELSLNILDITNNSLKAQATLIEIFLIYKSTWLEIKICDNGIGMSEEFLARVVDPFTTTRTTRKVGMGIPLFKMAAEVTGGFFEIKSKLGSGTTVRATFDTTHIDCVKLGDIADTLVSLIALNEEIDFVLNHQNQTEFTIDTRELRKVLSPVKLSEYEVLQYIRETINESINNNQ